MPGEHPEERKKKTGSGFAGYGVWGLALDYCIKRRQEEGWRCGDEG